VATRAARHQVLDLLPGLCYHLTMTTKRREKTPEQIEAERQAKAERKRMLEGLDLANPDQELTAEQAAAFLGTSYMYFRQLLLKYEITPSREELVTGATKRKFYKLSELEAFRKIWNHDKAHPIYGNKRDRELALKASWRRATQRYVSKDPTRPEQKRQAQAARRAQSVGAD
jgi:hypothetical protein